MVIRLAKNFLEVLDEDLPKSRIEIEYAYTIIHICEAYSKENIIYFHSMSKQNEVSEEWWEVDTNLFEDWKLFEDGTIQFKGGVSCQAHHL